MPTQRDQRIVDGIEQVLRGARNLVCATKVPDLREICVVWAKEAKDILEHLELLEEDAYLLGLADEVIDFRPERDRP